MAPATHIPAVALHRAAALDGAGCHGRLDAVLSAARTAPRTRHIGFVPTEVTTHTERFQLIPPAATFVLGDAEAADAAQEVPRAQVSPQIALRFIEQLWSTEAAS